MRAQLFGSRAAASLVRRHRSAICLVVGGLFLGGLAGICSAGQANWVGGTGLWTDPNNWDPAVVPNDGMPPFSIYSVVIGMPGMAPPAITLPSQGSPFNVFALTLKSGSLSLDSGSSLGVQGSSQSSILFNAGTINLAGGSTFIVPMTDTITGGGTINMSAGATLQGAKATPLMIGSQTIIGAGTLSLAANSGTIQTAPGQQLTLQGSFFNGGLLDAENGGSLIVSGSVGGSDLTNSLGIQAGPGSSVTLNGSAGGNLRVIGNGVIQGTGALNGRGSIDNSSTGVINLPRLFNDYTATIANPAGGQITLGSVRLPTGNAVFNAGTIHLQTLMGNLEGTVTPLLHGGGTIILGSAALPGTVQLYNGQLINVDQTIEGAGMWQAPFVNDGIIEANINNTSLTISFPNPPPSIATPYVNDGTMGASNGGHLIVNGAVTGAGGWLADGGKITFQNNPRITTVGPISVTNGGVLENNATAELGLAVTASNLTLDATSSITNHGDIRLFGNFSYAMTDPAKWSWPNVNTNLGLSRLTMDGGPNAVPQSATGWAMLELAEKDNGPKGPGFDTSFSIPALEIGPGAHVLLTDLLDNGNRGGPAGNPEALYVDQLSFDDPSGQINLDGLHLYYKKLTAGSASQIIDVPVSVPEPACLSAVLLGFVALARRRSRGDLSH